MFNHLKPGVRSLIENAFVEAENLLDFHNVSAYNLQTTRRISGLVASLVLSSAVSANGVEVSWDRSDDRRISFYEVQSSSDNIFSSPTTFTTADSRLTIDGVSQTLFLRARAVRYDGETGTWSNTVTTTPTAGGDQPVVHTATITDALTTTYSDADEFTHILRQTITTVKDTGGVTVWGSLGAKLSSIPAFALYSDVLRVRVNGEDIATMGNNTTIRHYERASTALSGGWSASFGPFFQVVPSTSHKFDNWVGLSASSHGSAGIGVTTDWQDQNNAEAPGDLTTFSFADWTITVPASQIRTGFTRYISLRGYNYNIPADHTVVGIEMTFHGEFDFTPVIANLIGTVGYRDVQVIIDGGLVGTAKAPGAVPADFPWAGSGSPVTFGGASDTWGIDSSLLTAEKFNATDFGISTRAVMTADNGTASSQTPTTTPKMSAVFMTIYTSSTSQVLVDLYARVGNGANERTVTNATVNAIEYGF